MICFLIPNTFLNEPIEILIWFSRLEQEHVQQNLFGLKKVTRLWTKLAQVHEGGDINKRAAQVPTTEINYSIIKHTIKSLWVMLQ